jgi:hypothetical protein
MRFVRNARLPSLHKVRIHWALPSGDMRMRAAAPARACRQAVLAGAPLVIAAAVGILLVSFTLDRTHQSSVRHRAADEAASFGSHSGLLATGDAFGGYIQLLRVAGEPEIHNLATPSDIRTAALRRMLELNTNRFDGLVVVGLDGRVIAATDGTLLNAPASEAFSTVRANQGNANSDIVLEAAGKPGYVDYASILVDASGAKWGVLLARADPARLWRSTLAATIDGGSNVIISREGLLAAGAQLESLGTPWRGREFAGGTIRAQVGGVDSICGLSAIAANTQIDHGWNVASCLPAATVLGVSSASSHLRLVAMVVLIAAGAALIAAKRTVAPLEAGIEGPPVAAIVAEPGVIAEESLPQEPAEPAPNVDARTLIAAYESRNARLALRIRDSVQARLLVASSRVEEAVELQEEDPVLARTMLERAAYDLDQLNEHELRGLNQELYPDLIRLGLPAALRALRKDIADVMEVEIDADAGADSVDEDSTRAIGTPRRLLLHRLVLDALREFGDAGLEGCVISLRHTPSTLWLAVKGHGDGGRLDEAVFEAHALSVEAHGGSFTFVHADDATEVVVTFEGAPADVDVANDDAGTGPESTSVENADGSESEAA